MKDWPSSAMAVPSLNKRTRVASTFRSSPPWYALGGREWTELAKNDGPSSAMALPPPVVAGEGAIDPADLPPIRWCGWEGETDIAM